MFIFTPNTLIKSSEVNSNFAELKTMTDYLTVPDTGWIEVGSGGTAPAFQNSWVNFDSAIYSTCAFRKDALGYVHMKGLIKSGSSNVSIFDLPVGYRPLKYHHFPSISNSLIGGIRIHATGSVQMFAGTNAWIDLAVIHFKAEQ